MIIPHVQTRSVYVVKRSKDEGAKTWERCFSFIGLIELKR
jgi:hypothetical protein